jgi:O-antigen/teichoic acid export membrane protein
MIELSVLKPFQRISNTRLLKIGREFAWVVAGHALVMVGSLVGVRILTGVLPPSLYGELALAMTLAMLVNQMVSGPVTQSALRFLSAARQAGELHGFFNALKQILRLMTLIVILIGLTITASLWLGGHVTWLALAGVAGVYAIIQGWNNVLNGLQNAARHRAVVAWHQAASTWSHFFLAWLLIIVFSVSSALAMTGYLIGASLVFLSQLWFFRSRFPKTDSVLIKKKPGTSLRWRSSMLSYAWPFVCWGGITWFQMASNRWALQIFSTTADVGLFSVLYQLGYAPMIALTGMLVQLAAPVFFERAGEGSDFIRIQNVYLLNWRLSKFMLVAAFGLFFIVFALHQTIFKIFVAPAYYSASGLLPFVFLSSSIFAVAQFTLISLLSENESISLIYPKVVTGLLGGGFNFIGAAWYGVPGVVAANIAYSMLYFGWIASLVHLRLKRFRAGQ